MLTEFLKQTAFAVAAMLCTTVIAVASAHNAQAAPPSARTAA